MTDDLASNLERLNSIVGSVRDMVDPIATDIVNALEAIASNTKDIAIKLEDIRDTLDEHTDASVAGVRGDFE